MEAKIGNHSTADLLFDWFGFNQSSKPSYKFNITKLINPT